MMDSNFTSKISQRSVLTVLIIAGLCLYSLPLDAVESKNKKPKSYSIDVEDLAKDIFASCELFQEGKKLYENRDYPGARTKFREALATDPGNKKASKYLKLCADRIPKPKPRTVSKKKADLNTKKTSEDIQLLQTLINRVDKLETKPAPKTVTAIAPAHSPQVQKQKKEKQFSKKASARFTEKARLSQQTQYTAEKRKVESVTLKEIAVAESLVKEGNKYYENLNYEKAYKLYSEALEILNSPTRSD